MKNLWGTVACGQNLDVKELSGLTRRANSWKGMNALSAHCHGLGDDRRFEWEWQGQISHQACGNCLARFRAVMLFVNGTSASAQLERTITIDVPNAWSYARRLPS